MVNNKRAKDVFNSPGVRSLYSSLICIIIGLAVGFIVLLMLSPRNALSGFVTIIKGGFSYGGLGIASAIANSVPIIMTGLSVIFAFKTGLFNIGAAGQYTLGAFGGFLFAIVLDCPWYVCLIMATLFGAIWGAIPGIFKAFFNVNEVITSIMFNWIGLYLVNDIIYGGGTGVMYDRNYTKTYNLKVYHPSSVVPTWGLEKVFNSNTVTIAIFIAIIVAVVVWVILQKTKLGYELKSCGFNKNASRYAGISEKKSIIISMVIAGALAGLGGGLYYLSGTMQWNPQNSNSLPAQGFDGISVALLAMLNPLASVFSALLISHLAEGGGNLDPRYFSREIANLITGVIIYLCAFSLFFKNKINDILGRKDRLLALKIERESIRSMLPTDKYVESDDENAQKEEADKAKEK
ncbi:MAG: ABC transporter permease [Clostridia bacterium]|nr:ABC transporter permease [Clostridia bacterium]